MFKVKKAEKVVVKRFVEARTGMDLILVEGGCFLMGDLLEEGNINETPVHEVCLNDFYIGRYPVTQGQWSKIMWGNPSHFKEGDECERRPVEEVSWEDAQEFLIKINKETGYRFRLPTEAEWEYACRSGGKNERYSGGYDINRVGWHYNNADLQTHPVGKKEPNGLGLFDMCGNVSEWVEDTYDENSYSIHERDNPVYMTGSMRVLRGGNIFRNAMRCRSSVRDYYSPDYKDSCIGFRLAMTP